MSWDSFFCVAHVALWCFSRLLGECTDFRGQFSGWQIGNLLSIGNTSSSWRGRSREAGAWTETTRECEGLQESGGGRPCFFFEDVEKVEFLKRFGVQMFQAVEVVVDPPKKSCQRNDSDSPQCWIAIAFVCMFPLRSSFISSDLCFFYFSHWSHIPSQPALLSRWYSFSNNHTSHNLTPKGS